MLLTNKGVAVKLCNWALVVALGLVVSAGVVCEGAEPKIDKVFFAQHHVLEPDDELFKLVGDLGALIKVQVYSETPVASPSVSAKLVLEGRTTELALRGPKMLPKRPIGDPVLMEHSYDDSFTVMIPRGWVKTGLKVAVELRDYDYSHVDDDDLVYKDNVAEKNITIIDSRSFDDLKIGAPSKTVLQAFDIHFFGRGKGADFPVGWERELEAKLPVSELTIHRVKNLMFNEMVVLPRNGRPADTYTSVEDYKERTGEDYDGEQGLSLRWCDALKAAGGRYGLWRPYHINIAGVYSGGQAGGYRSCANLHRHGLIIHELGHTFGLPHWIGKKYYPYTRSMYGESQGEEVIPNAGPRWAFDVGRREFLSAREMVDGELVWKRDPMQGGGRSNMKDYMYRHFSDYSIHRMQSQFERAAYWNEESGEYARWNQETGEYDEVIENNGVLFPIERDVDVISLLVTANAVVPKANIIYAPIGPYTAGLIRVFDADSAEDRAAAEKVGYTANRCNVCVKVTQGGKVKTYLMLAKVSADDDPLRSFNASAINLAARDGEVTEVDLLHTPDVIEKGVTADSKVLYSWKK